MSNNRNSTMKALRVDADKSFAGFLTAMDIPFMYLYGCFYILNTSNPSKFKVFCETRGVRDCDLAKMTFRKVELDIEGIPEEL